MQWHRRRVDRVVGTGTALACRGNGGLMPRGRPRDVSGSTQLSGSTFTRRSCSKFCVDSQGSLPRRTDWRCASPPSFATVACMSTPLRAARDARRRGTIGRIQTRWQHRPSRRVSCVCDAVQPPSPQPGRQPETPNDLPFAFFCAACAEQPEHCPLPPWISGLVESAYQAIAA